MCICLSIIEIEFRFHLSGCGLWLYVDEGDFLQEIGVLYVHEANQGKTA